MDGVFTMTNHLARAPFTMVWTNHLTLLWLMSVPRNSLVVLVALHVWIERREVRAEVDKRVIFVAFLTRPDVNWSNNR